MVNASLAVPLGHVSTTEVVTKCDQDSGEFVTQTGGTLPKCRPVEDTGERENAVAENSGESQLFLHFQSAPTPRGTSTSTGSSSRRATLPLRLARSASAT